MVQAVCDTDVDSPAHHLAKVMSLRKYGGRMRRVLCIAVTPMLLIAGCGGDDDPKADALQECLDTLSPIAGPEEVRAQLELNCEVAVERLFDQFNPDRARVELRLVINELCDDLASSRITEEAACDR